MFLRGEKSRFRIGLPKSPGSSIQGPNTPLIFATELLANLAAFFFNLPLVIFIILLFSPSLAFMLHVYLLVA